MSAFLDLKFCSAPGLRFACPTGNMTADYRVQLDIFVKSLKKYVDENDQFVTGFIASIRTQ